MPPLPPTYLSLLPELLSLGLSLSLSLSAVATTGGGRRRGVRRVRGTFPGAALMASGIMTELMTWLGLWYTETRAGGEMLRFGAGDRAASGELWLLAGESAAAAFCFLLAATSGAAAAPRPTVPWCFSLKLPSTPQLRTLVPFAGAAPMVWGAGRVPGRPAMALGRAWGANDAVVAGSPVSSTLCARVEHQTDSWNAKVVLRALTSHQQSSSPFRH